MTYKDLTTFAQITAFLCGSACVNAVAGDTTEFDFAYLGRLEMQTNVALHFGNLAVRGDRLFASPGNGAARIFDISDVDHPSLVGDMGIGDHFQSVGDAEWYGEHLFVSTGPLNGSGVAIYHESDLFSALPDRILPDQPIVNMLFENDLMYAVRAYFGSNVRELIIVDVTNPTSSVPLGEISFTDSLTPEVIRTGLDIDQGLVFLAGGEFGLHVIDSSTPTDPKLVNAFVNEHAIHDIEVRSSSENNFSMLVANGEGGVLGLGLRSNSSSIQVYGDLPIDHLGGEATQLVWHDDLCFVVVTGVGVVVVDVSDPYAMEQVGLIPLDFLQIDDILIHDDVLYVIEPRQVRLFDLMPGGDACSNIADLNGDGALSFLDVSSFLSGYQEMSVDVDFNGDSSWDYFDVAAFLSNYLAGCP